jgi:ketosteroid isomerase-like protein
MRPPAARLVLPALALALLAGCAGRSSVPDMDLAASRIAIVNMVQTFNTAIAAGDTAAIDSLYAADASVLPANAPRVEGRAAIHRLWAGALGSPGFEMTLEAGPITFARSGDFAVMTGVYRYGGTGPGGLPLGETGKFVSVYTATGGRWRILVDTWNADAPPRLGG